MLESENNRPADADTIYAPEFDIAKLKERFKQRSDKIKTAVENSEITITTRQPSGSLLAALIIDVTAYSERLDRAMVTIRALSTTIGRELRDIEIDIGNRQVGINIEEYIPSSFKNQTAYTVADLTG